MKFLLFPSLILTILFISGCSNLVESPEEIDTKPAKETEELVLTDDYVGLSVEEAQAYARAREVSFRVVERDGQPLPVTMDYRPGRINAKVEDGVVVSYEVEGQESTPNAKPEKPAVENYDANSWKSMIADSCESFFDGCNTCRRMPGEAMAACTRMFCQAYERPRCLDNEQANKPQASNFGGRSTRYACDEQNTFRVAYDQYINDSGIVRLQPDQIMFEDDQTKTQILMNRTVAASGERYESEEGLVFWSQGLGARLMEGENNLYENCEEL